MMSTWTLLGLLVATSVPARAQDNETYAIQGGTVHTLVGDPIENGTVIVTAGRITAVGPDIQIPSGATVIDASGRHVYPGLFNAFSQLGLQEINAVDVTNDMRELGSFNPQLTAATAIHPASERIPVTRANGITHVVSAPSTGAGGIAGRASAIHLDGWTIEDMLIEPAVGLVINWPSMQTRRFNRQTFRVENRSFREVREQYEEAVSQLADWLEDARVYRHAMEGGGTPARDLKLEALSTVLTGALPVLVLADEARDIRNAVAFAETNGLRMILVGGRDAWKETALLVEHDVPVLLRATQNLPPQRDDPYSRAFSTPALLSQAGVRYAITGWASSGPNPPSRTLPYEAANAVKFGLSADEALRAITRYPAEILGLGDDLGTIQDGKIGNLIVTDGDPLQIRTQILHVFVNGRPVDLDNKHRALYERYRARD